MMKPLHVIALVCFVLAMVFYAVAWMPGAAFAGAIGVLLEVLFWVAMFKARKYDGPDQGLGNGPWAQTSEEPLDPSPSNKRGEG